MKSKVTHRQVSANLLKINVSAPSRSVLQQLKTSPFKTLDCITPDATKIMSCY